MSIDPIAEFTATWYYRVPFHRDNPVVAPLVDTYLAGGPRPTDQQLGNNHYALGLVALEDARRAGLPPTEPPPPSGRRSPLGYYRLSDGQLASNPDKYGTLMVSTGGATAAGKQPGRSLVYTSAISCHSTNPYGVSAAEARALGVVLKDANGGEIINAQYPGNVIADPGSDAYRAKWCANVEGMVSRYGVDGFWMDDFVRGPKALTGGKVPAKYPTQASWQAAIEGFLGYVVSYFKPRGIYVAANAQAGDSGAWDVDGSLHQTWWPRLMDLGINGLMSEYWLTTDSGDDILLTEGSGYPRSWDGWRALHPLCTGRGVDLLGVQYVGGAKALYCTATFLLDWDGQHGAILNVPSGDPWDATYAKVATLGLPTGPAIKMSGVWRRPFENGAVTVDARNGTAQIV